MEISKELADNYQALHDAGESWEAIANRSIDENMAAYCRSQAAKEDGGDGKPRGRRSPAKDSAD